jgi:hypothetical protein
MPVSGPESWTATLPDAPATCDVYRIDAAGLPQVALQTLPGPDGLRFADGTATADGTYGTIGADDGMVTVTAAPAIGPTLRDSTLSAEYLIIAPADLTAEAQRLADHRQGQGLSARVVPVEQIYEEFAGGHREPMAIQTFLRWAMGHWQDPKPSHVLLFGDGHYDGLDRSGTQAANPLPPLMSETALVGEVPDDTRLTSLTDGRAMPSFFVGRLPVNTLAEARIMVDKLIAYDQADGSWLSEGIAVNDDDDGRFAAMIDATMQAFPDRQWTRFGIDAATDLKTRLQSGAGLTVYVGHGSDWGWAQEDVFNGDDVASLYPDDRTGVVIAANCLNGYFASPYFPALAEAMVTRERAGAVAYLSTSGFTLPANQEALLADICRYAGDPDLDLGAAMTLAKLHLYLRGGPLWEDEIAGWLLLGDPATRLRR